MAPSPASTTTEPTAAQRKFFAKMGIAMPDGSYYIRNAGDLQNAIDSVGQGEDAGDNGDTIRKFIMKRAAALKLSSKIPAAWNPDGSLKHASTFEGHIVHLDEPTTAQRKLWAQMGIAMPDGSYYIRNADDLDNAIRAVGRASGSNGTSDEQQRNAVRCHIMKRAAALKLTSKIPDTWNQDGTLKQSSLSDIGAAFLSHYGVKHVPDAGISVLSQARAVQAAYLAHLDNLGRAVTMANEKHMRRAIRMQGPELASARASYAQYVAHVKLLEQRAIVQHAARMAVFVEQAPEDQKEAVRKLADTSSLAHYGVVGMKWGTRGGKPAQQMPLDAHQQHVDHVAHLTQMSIEANQAHAAQQAQIATQIAQANTAHTAQVARLQATGQKQLVIAAQAKHDAHVAHLKHLAHEAHLTHEAYQAHLAALVAKAKGAAKTVATKVKTAVSAPPPPNVSRIVRQSALDGDILAHYGVRGMKWGVRNASSAAEEGGSSEDAARAAKTQAQINKHGIGSVSSGDLKHLVARKQLEQQHGQLTQRHVSAGEKVAKEILVQMGRQKAAALAGVGIAAGAAVATAHLARAFNVR